MLDPLGCRSDWLSTRWARGRSRWPQTVAQQGMPWQVMIKMFGHGDFKLILETYYAQNDDARLLEEASKIDFGLGHLH